MGMDIATGPARAFPGSVTVEGAGDPDTRVAAIYVAHYPRLDVC